MAGFWMAQWRVLARVRLWLTGSLVFVVFGVCAGAAGAVTFTQKALLPAPSPIVGTATGIAVDGAGDVFSTNVGLVFELPPGGSPQTLPFSGLSAASGVAVDGAGTCSSLTPLPPRCVRTAGGQVAADAAVQRAVGTCWCRGRWGGDVFVADLAHGRVVELRADGSQQTLPFSGLAFPSRSRSMGRGTCTSRTRVMTVWSSCQWRVAADAAVQRAEDPEAPSEGVASMRRGMCSSADTLNVAGDVRAVRGG